MSLVALVTGGLLGAAAGPFINAAATRLPAGLGPLGPPACAGCKSQLPRAALRPGWNGACPSCGAATPRRRHVTELAAVALGALAFAGHGLALGGLAVAVFSLVLLLILRIDWQHHLIYTATIGPGLLLALALAAIHSWSALASAALGGLLAAVAFGLFFALGILIYRKHALGAGDIMLAGLIGAMTGVHHVLGALLLGMILGGFGGLLLVLLGIRKRTDYIPYGAYLCAGAIVVLLAR